MLFMAFLGSFPWEAVPFSRLHPSASALTGAGNPVPVTIQAGFRPGLIVFLKYGAGLQKG